MMRIEKGGYMPDSEGSVARPPKASGVTTANMKIEITEEMMEAGFNAASSICSMSGYDEIRDGAVSVYLAMERVRRQSSYLALEKVRRQSSPTIANAYDRAAAIADSEEPAS